MKKPSARAGKFIRMLAKTKLARTISAGLMASFLAGVAAPAVAQPRDPDRYPIETLSIPTVPLKGSYELSDQQLSNYLTRKGFTLGSSVYIKIFKLERQLELWMQKSDRFEKVDTFKIAIIRNTPDKLGPKIKTGDRITPEGVYEIKRPNVTTGTQFLLAIDFGFPNQVDRKLDRNGSLVRIHSDLAKIKEEKTKQEQIFQVVDTRGCPILKHEDNQIVFGIVKAALKHGNAGTIYSFPFRMHTENLQAYKKHAAAHFWNTELKPIHDALNRMDMPVRVSMANGRYTLLDGSPQPAIAYADPQPAEPVRTAPQQKKSETRTRSTLARVGPDELPPVVPTSPTLLPKENVLVTKPELPQNLLCSLFSKNGNFSSTDCWRAPFDQSFEERFKDRTAGMALKL